MNLPRPPIPDPAGPNQQLFSYGTLQQPDVQRAVFRHEITGTPDAIVGYSIAEISITDPKVIAASGAAIHKILTPDPDGPDITGTRYALDERQLAAADNYEVDDYERVRVTLRSGVDAWLYAAAELPRRAEGLNLPAADAGRVLLREGKLQVASE